MNFRGISFVFLATILVVIFWFPAFAFGQSQGMCSSLFLRGPVLDPVGSSTFESLENLEKDIDDLILLATASMGRGESSDRFLSTILHELGDLGSQVHDMQDRALEDLYVSSFEIIALRSRSAEARVQLEGVVDGDLTSVSSSNDVNLPVDFDLVIQDPALVAPDQVYVIPISDGLDVRVLFSEKLVSELFLSREITLIRSLRKSLELIPRGLFGRGWEGTGMKRLHGDDDVVEIRTRGLNSNLRLYGYIHEGVIHFVSWTISSDHSARAVNRYRAAVYAARDARGH